MTFELPLTEERIKPHQVIALHLFVAFIWIITASLVLASSYAVTKMPSEDAARYKFLIMYGMAIAAALYAASLVLIVIVIANSKWLQKPLNNLVLRVFQLLILVVLIVYSLLHSFMVPALIYTVLFTAIILAISWERKKDIPLTVLVDKEGIKPPFTSRIRAINWADVEHVILRFGTLTVNCTDNRLYQWNIGNLNFETEVFEVFCIRQVDKAKEKRDNNDW